MIEVLIAELRDRIFLSILMIWSQLSRHSLPVLWLGKCCVTERVALARSKVMAQLLCGSLAFPIHDVSWGSCQLRCSSSHSAFEVVYCSKSLLHQMAWQRHNLNLSFSLVFSFASLRILLHWDLGLSLFCGLMMQVPRKQTWKNCSSQSWDHVLWWQSVWNYSSWQSDLLNFQFLLWE